MRAQDLVGYLSVLTPQHLLEDDKWRLSHFFYGLHAECNTHEGASLIFGGKSGLLPLRWAINDPRYPVHVVERDRFLREVIGESAQSLGVNNLILHASSDACMASLGDESRVLGKVWVDWKYFSASLVEALVTGFRIGYLAGEFDEWLANPLWLHRGSREAARQFYWHNATVALPMSGRQERGPDVTLIVPLPVQQVPDEIYRSLAILLAQSLIHVELLLVMPAECDPESGLWLGPLRDIQDDRIRVLRAPAWSMAEARTFGLREASGLFVAFADAAQGGLEPSMLGGLLESAVRFNSDIAFCRHPSGSSITAAELNPQTGSATGLLVEPRALLGCPPLLDACLFRRRFLQEHGLSFPAEAGQFHDVAFRFMAHALSERTSVLSCAHGTAGCQARSVEDSAHDESSLERDLCAVDAVLRDFVCRHYEPSLEKALFLNRGYRYRQMLADTPHDGARRDMRRRMDQAILLQQAILYAHVAQVDEALVEWVRSEFITMEAGEYDGFSDALGGGLQI
ncbi:hypothetical protein, partial [Methyloparacoccus murrellii]